MLGDLWANNKAEESSKGGHRRGFMGYVVLLASNILQLEGRSWDPVTLFYAAEEKVEAKRKWYALVDGEIRPVVDIISKPLVR